MIFKGQRQNELTSWVFFWHCPDAIQKGRTLIKRIIQVCSKIWNWPQKIRFNNLTSFESGAHHYLASLINPLVLHARIEPTGQLYWKFMSHDDTWLLLLNEVKKLQLKNAKNVFHIYAHILPVHV